MSFVLLNTGSKLGFEVQSENLPYVQGLDSIAAVLILGYTTT